jgi:hypothetical protein
LTVNEARCLAALCDQLIPPDGDPGAEWARVVNYIAVLEKGEVPSELWKKPRAQAFFEMLLSHTMEGYYGDPRHGGNRDHVSGWAFLPAGARTRASRSEGFLAAWH